MKKEEVVEEVTMEELEEVCEPEEEVKEGLLTKVKNGFKKHGKKVAVGAAVAVAGVVGYMLGSKSECDSDYIDSYDPELLEADSDSVEVTEF